MNPIAISISGLLTAAVAILAYYNIRLYNQKHNSELKFKATQRFAEDSITKIQELEARVAALQESIQAAKTAAKPVRKQKR